MLKLRTMHAGTPAHSVITTRNDSRIFRAGRLIRRLKLDELPQLVNVVRGEMALIGPRPEDPAVVAQHYAPWMWETLEVPPGVVGPGSLGYFLEEENIPDDPTAANAYYVSTLLPRKLARDLVYVRNRSVAYDVQLIVRTLCGIAGARRLMRAAEQREEMAAESVLNSITGTTA